MFNASRPSEPWRRSPQGGKDATIGFSGTMAGLQFFRYPLSQSEADCLYRNGEFTVGVCQEVSKMDSLHYFQSFLPTERDFSGATIV